MTKTTGPVAAIAEAAVFQRADLGPAGTVVLGLMTTDGPIALQLSEENASDLSMAIIATLATEEIQNWAFPVSNPVGALSEDGALLLRFRIGNGYLPLSLEAEEIEALHALLGRALDPARSNKPAPH